MRTGLWAVLALIVTGVLAVLAASTATSDEVSSNESVAAPAATIETVRPTTSERVTTTTKPSPTTTKASPTTTEPSPPETERAATTAASSTTEPPTPPAVLLDEVESGLNRRFDPCGNPISIRFNPDGHLTPERTAELEDVLREEALVLSDLTGMEIVYTGPTDQQPVAQYRSGEFILVHVGDVGDGLLDGDYGSTSFYSWDRRRNGFVEVDSYQVTVRADALTGGSSSARRWFLMSRLGDALGLEYLDDENIDPFGIPESERPTEIMDLGGYRYLTEWGPGDRQGLALVGAAAGCF